MTLVATSLLALGACTAPTDGDDPGTEPTEEIPTPAEVSESDDPGDEVEPEGIEDDVAHSPLTITLNGDLVEFEPTDVWCKVSGGELRHVIAKTNNRPPLLEVTPGEFAMLKVDQQGAPQKTNSPTGIEFITEQLTFTDTRIGSVIVNGSLECTSLAGRR